MTRRYRAGRIRALGLLLAAMTVTAAAEETALDTLVITGTRTEKSISDSPVQVTVLQREELEARQVNTVAEALRHIPGVQLGSIHGDEGEQVIMQGMQGDQVAVLIDGMPVSASTGSTVNLSRLNLNQVERIEVVRGATSALYGSDAMGGVVNIITAEPARPEGRVRWQGTSYGDLNTDDAALGLLGEQRLSLSGATGQIGPLSNRLSFDFRESYGSDRNPDVRTQDTFSGQTWSVDNRLSLEHGAHSWRLDTELFVTDLWRPVDEDGVPFNYTDETLRLAGALRWQRPSVLGDDIDSTTQARLERFDQTTTQDAILTDVTEREREAEMWLRSVSQQWDAQWGEHLLTLGMDYRYSSLEQTRTTQALDGTTSSTEEVSERSQQDFAFYVQDDFFVGDRLELLPGARAQWDEGFGFFLAPKLNLRWDPTWLEFPGATGHLRAGVGVGYRVPNLKERYYFFDHSQFGYQVRGNPDLDPEQNLSWQLGMALSGQRWSADFGVYLNQAENLIVTDLDEAASQQANLDIYRYQNIDEAEIRGMDAEGRLQLSPQWETRLAYSYTEARNRETDNRLPGRTPHVVTAGVEWQPLDRVQWLASARHHSRTWSDSDNTQRTPAWVDLGTVVNVEAGRHLELFAGGDNLLDEYQPLDTSGDRRPLIGRRVFAGVQGRF
ncbi:TonB-dependent receptor plug domain-containing protein [Natronospirillum operosum]|uniref:TonB-dependent receptor plug domain-containing protein n=1 Tax=Natronospirillum operosum TaxID=2759953 RepID=UPI00143686F7|nr:TonB-dependent receptor [Natronospirillum operosum]